MKNIEKIAIGMACYKPDPEYLRQQLESIEKQSFKNWICVLTFDSDLAEIQDAPGLRKYFDHPQFFIFQNPQRYGVLKNFERSLHKALELCPDLDAFGFCDQDDVWYPNKLANSRELLQRLPPISAVHTNSRLIFSNLGQTQASDLDSWGSEQRGTKLVSLQDLTIRNVAAGASMLMDAELAQKYKFIPPDFTEYDWWFACAAAANGGLYPVDGLQYDYRQHSTNVLGISPYTGFFRLKTRDKKGQLLSRFEQTFRATNLRFEKLSLAPFRYGLCSKLGFSRRFYDAGIFLVLAGLKSLPVDRPLARAYIVRAIGKNLYFLHRLLGRSPKTAEGI